MNLAKADIKLETKYVCFVKGKFYIPSFQRGYRWGAMRQYVYLMMLIPTGRKNIVCSRLL